MPTANAQPSLKEPPPPATWPLQPAQRPAQRPAWWWGGLTLLLAFYLVSVFTTRAAFFIDEASIAYNALMIARTSADEYGARWPLYFRAFGEYKNPIYIYLLAVLYKIFGPSTLLARLFSAGLGFAAALLLGQLSGRVTQQTVIGIIVAVTALLTPWLFEVSRLVFEVALFPLALVLFLLALERAQARARWSGFDILRLGLTLALITYSYSIGRLFAPLLALGLLLFTNRARFISILQTWLCYAVLLTPLFIFQWRQPGALGGRFSELTYLTPTSSWFEVALEFVKHYLSNLNPLSLLLSGDPNRLHHIPGMGSLLAVPFLLAVGGVVLVIRHQFQNAWWRFALYGLLISAVPASLTKDDLHTLRLIPLPIFLLLFTAPALAWLWESGQSMLRRHATILLLSVMALQAVLFQWQYYKISPRRDVDYGYQRVLDAALATAQRPLYVIADNWGNFGYIHAYWQAVLQGTDTSHLVRLADVDLAPAHAVVISEIASYRCTNCKIIKRLGPYLAYVTL